MADDDQQSIDTSDSVRHGSDDARAKAIAKMQEAIKRQKESSESLDADVVQEEPDEDTKAPENVELGPTNTELVQQIRADQASVLSSVKVYSPFHVYFDGEAKSVSAVNRTGPFDILPGHKNFISLLSQGEVLIRTERGEERLEIQRGFMHVSANNVSVFLDV